MVPLSDISKSATFRNTSCSPNAAAELYEHHITRTITIYKHGILHLAAEYDSCSQILLTSLLNPLCHCSVRGNLYENLGACSLWSTVQVSLHQTDDPLLAQPTRHPHPTAGPPFLHHHWLHCTQGETLYPFIQLATAGSAILMVHPAN